MITDPKKHEKPSYVGADVQRVTLEPTAVEVEKGQPKGGWHPTTGETYDEVNPETGKKSSLDLGSYGPSSSG